MSAVRCDMGCLVDEADICPDHKGMCKLCCGAAKEYLVRIGERFQLPDCECPGPDPEPTGYSDMVANQAHRLL